MIKVCSLEFLNKNSFDVDIMLSDGRVLFSAGSEITPEVLLKLYYKDIYVEKPLMAALKSGAELKTSSTKEDEESMVSAGVYSSGATTDESSSAVADLKVGAKVGEEVILEAEADERKANSAKEETVSGGVELKSSEKGGKSSSDGGSDGVELKAVTRDGGETSELVELEAVSRAEKDSESENYSGTKSKTSLGGHGGGSRTVATSAIIGSKDAKGAEVAVELDSENKIETEAENTVVAENIDVAASETEGVSKSSADTSVAAGARKSGGTVGHKKSETPHPETPVEPVIEEDPNPPLEFNEEQAQRVAELSVRLAAVLSMGAKQQDEVKQAAYYHNIGRSKFRKLDLEEKDFKKRQAVAGYNHILNDLKLSPKIAEAAMFYNKKYQSSELNLKSGKQADFPYSHIVAVTNYYDELTSEGLSKSATLMKMLELGGNKFNVFILHKFIHMVRK